MRKIVVASIKGGVGKTMVSSNLARSLKRLGFSVGYLDADITAPTGSEAFGLEKLPDWELDAAADGGKGAIVPYDVDGIQFITLASHFGQAPAVLWNEERKIDAARQLLQGVVAWDNLDWLVLDTPLLCEILKCLFEVIIAFGVADYFTANYAEAVWLWWNLTSLNLYFFWL